MAGPLYPSLIPRYVDESWFSSDEPIDEAARLSELEANHDNQIRDTHYRSVDIGAPHIEPIDEDGNDEEDDEAEMNEDIEEDDDDLEDDGEMEDDFIANDSPLT